MSHSGKRAGKSSKPAAPAGAKVVTPAKPGAKPAAKKPLKAKGGVQKPKPKRINHNKLPIFEKSPRNFGIGGNIQPKRDLTRFVRWPKYIRLQRQKSILLKRLKVPGTINQFSRAADRNTAASLFTFLEKYRPETRKQKEGRLLRAAKVDVKAVKGEKVAAKPADKGEKVVVAKKKQHKPKVVKYGLNHVTSLIESKKASLVIIAHDVDPLELVLWLPTLCRKKDVPYIIVKGKARLGKVVHKKTAAVLCITSVRESDKKAFELLVQKGRDNFLSRYSELARATGGQVMGHKHNMARTKEERSRKAIAK
jgi:large subunit ribosomal protein L7Ae